MSYHPIEFYVITCHYYVTNIALSLHIYHSPMMDGSGTTLLLTKSNSYYYIMQDHTAT